MFTLFSGPFLKGCLTTIGLICAIGPQNAFVLKQGLLKNRVFLTAAFCVCVDACLMLLGIGGLGILLTSNEFFLSIAKWGGAAFLMWYGFKSFKSVFRSQSLQAEGGPRRPTLKETLLILLGVSFLNPHVYLDTVILLGTIGSQFENNERHYFSLGAVFGTMMWFFTLCYGARLLAPLFQKPLAWKILDAFVGVIMWAIALSLILGM